MKEVKFSGVGLHSGKMASVIVKPTKSGGIVFIRNKVRMPAIYSNITPSPYRTTIVGNHPNQIHTIEHIMCALFISGIINAEIIVDNMEMPILDGNTMQFIDILKNIKPAGKIRYLRVKKPVVVRQSELRIPLWLRIFNFLNGNKKKNAYVCLSPTDKNELEISAEIDYKVPVIGRQEYTFIFDYDNFEKSVKKFKKEIAPSRTFGSAKEWEWLKKHNMGKGVNGVNVIGINRSGDAVLNDLYYKSKADRESIIKEYGYLLPKGQKIIPLHFPDEFVRHKILDAVGDLYTSGFRIIGKMDFIKGGSHMMNNIILKKLFENPENYEIVDIE